MSQVNLSKPQQALLSTIDCGQTIITECIEDLELTAEVPLLGTDPASVRWKEITLDSNKQTVTSQIAAMNAATAEVVTLTSCKFIYIYNFKNHYLYCIQSFVLLNIYFFFRMKIEFQF